MLLTAEVLVIPGLHFWNRVICGSRCVPLRLEAVHSSNQVNSISLDDRQITHLICVRLKHFLYDFFTGGVWGLLPVVLL